MMYGIWLKNHYSSVKNGIFVLCSIPSLLIAYFFSMGKFDENPLAQLTHITGRSAILILAASLSVTPLRRLLCTLSIFFRQTYGKRLSDWNWLIRLRRMLGLWSFFYAMSHACIYIIFDINYDWSAALQDCQDKPYLLVGVIALFLLSLLAITSLTILKKRLGRHWVRLHKCVYGIAILTLIHFWWSVKPGIQTPIPDTILLTILLGYRIALKLELIKRWDGYEGVESGVRPVSQALTPLRDTNSHESLIIK